jgi:membrane-bound metal-dependent hydrolase YbcI (DUF457 family)
MVFPFSHLITAWVIGKIYEKTSKNKISHYGWIALLFGAVLPDADFLLDWTINTELHRTFTHSLFFVMTTPLFLSLILKILDKNKVKKINRKELSVALGIGILSHLLLDMFAYHGVPLLWPSLINVSYFFIGYYNPANPSFLYAPLENLQSMMKVAIIDMGFGTAWIFYLLWKKRMQP